MQNVVINMCEKFHNDQMRNDRALENGKSDNNNTKQNYKKLSYCWETVRRESMPRIAEMDVEMTT